MFNHLPIISGLRGMRFNFFLCFMLTRCACFNFFLCFVLTRCACFNFFLCFIHTRCSELKVFQQTGYLRYPYSNRRCLNFIRYGYLFWSRRGFYHKSSHWFFCSYGIRHVESVLLAVGQVVFGANATGAIGSSCCSNSKLIITLAATNNIQTTIIKGWCRCHVLSKAVLLWCTVKSASSTWLVGLKTSLKIFSSDPGLTLSFAMRDCFAESVRGGSSSNTNTGPPGQTAQGHHDEADKGC